MNETEHLERIEAAIEKLALVQANLAIAILDIHRRIQPSKMNIHNPVVMTPEDVVALVKEAGDLVRELRGGTGDRHG